MRGGDTAGLRAFNERRIVGVVRRAGALSKADIARATGLSGQAASVIVNALLDAGILMKLKKVRGQVGQPSTPVALNPSGAYSLGVKIGRRSVEVILVNLLGEVMVERRQAHEAPLPDASIRTALGFVRELLDDLHEVDRARVIGIGIAMPGALHEWAAELGLPEGALDGWREADVTGEFERATGLQVTLYNDASAACAAELFAGDGLVQRSALYVYLGTFIGGGVVIGGRLYLGEQGNAGAVGSMPMAGGGRRPDQLIHRASLIQLERALDAAGLQGAAEIARRSGPEADAVFEAWADAAAREVARAAVAALSVIDFQAVVVDGLLNPGWRRGFVHRLRLAMKGFDQAGLTPAEIATGSIGPTARVLGAALLPLHARFAPDPALLARPANEAVLAEAAAAFAERYG